MTKTKGDQIIYNKTRITSIEESVWMTIQYFVCFFTTDDVLPKMTEHNGIHAVTSLYVLQQKVSISLLRFPSCDSQKAARLKVWCNASTFWSLGFASQATHTGCLIPRFHLTHPLPGLCDAVLFHLHTASYSCHPFCRNPLWMTHPAIVLDLLLNMTTHHATPVSPTTTGLLPSLMGLLPTPLTDIPESPSG